MAEIGFQHWGPDHGGQVRKNQNVGIILKRHGVDVVQYVQTLARSMNEVFEFEDDIGIDTDTPDTLTLSVISVTETLTEDVAPGNPKVLPVNTTPNLLTVDKRFTKFKKPVILGTSFTLTITAYSTAITSAAAALDVRLQLAALGKIFTTPTVNFKPKTFNTVNGVKFEIPLTFDEYQFLGIDESANATDPNVVTFSFSKYTANPAAGGDYTLHPIDILGTTGPPTGGHNDYTIDAVANFGLTDHSFAQLDADSAYLVSRTRTLNIEGPATESTDVTAFPVLNPA